MTGGASLAQLEQRLGYVFRDKTLLERALTTPACRMDHPELPDNQRLEFLGDAVFGLLSADAVFAAYPDEQEGPLTVRRTHLVSGAMLAKVAERMGLRDHLRRNKGASPLPPRAKPLSDNPSSSRKNWASSESISAISASIFALIGTGAHPSISARSAVAWLSSTFATYRMGFIVNRCKS